MKSEVKIIAYKGDDRIKERKLSLPIANDHYKKENLSEYAHALKDSSLSLYQDHFVIKSNGNYKKHSYGDRLSLKGYTLNIDKIELEKSVFKKDEFKELGKKKYYQVVVSVNDNIIESFLTKKKKYTYFMKGRNHRVELGQTADWSLYEFQDLKVKSRRIASSRLPFSARVQRPDFKMESALVGLPSVLFIAIMLGIQFLIPDSFFELKDINYDQNKYTKMIIDEVDMEKKKKIAQELLNQKEEEIPEVVKEVPKQVKKKTVARVQPTPSVKTSKKPVKVNKSVGNSKKMASLLGKLSERSGSSALKVGSTGKLASLAKDSGVAGSRGLLERSSSLKSVSRSLSGSGISTSKLTSGSRSISSLQSGSVGSASVKGIEVETEVRGGLEKSVIMKHIKKHLGSIRYCYEKELILSPSLSGKVNMKFDILGNGRVSAAKVGTSTLRNSKAESCMVSALSKWSFPKPEGGTTVSVSYPFLFKPTR